MNSPEQISVAIASRADAFYTQEIERQRQRNPQRLAAESPESLAAYRERLRSEAEADAQDIATKSDRFCKRAAHGWFHPENKISRQFFEAVTGVTLPAKVADTFRAVDQWAGGAVTAWLQARAEERQREEQSRADAKAAQESARVAAIGERIAAGESVDGEGLIDVARSLGIDVHPRTVGMIRRRVRSVTESTARIIGKGNVYSAFDLYKQCRGALSAT